MVRGQLFDDLTTMQKLLYSLMQGGRLESPPDLQIEGWSKLYDISKRLVDLLEERSSDRPAYKPFLKTQRFDIFHQQVVRNPALGHPRDVYTAWHREEDVPYPIFTVVLFPTTTLGAVVEDLFVHSDWRESVVETEVLLALSGELGKLEVCYEMLLDCLRPDSN